MGTLFLVALLLLVPNAGARSDAQLDDQAPVVTEEVLGPSSTVFSYQGQLLDADGDPVDQSVDMTFSLFYEEEGGTAFWTEAHTGAQAVEVSDGLFHVTLGSLAPIDPADLSGDVYLEVVVSGETLSPRELLTSVPFAVEARGVWAPLDVDGWITSRGSDGGVLSSQNPNNQAAGVQLCWHDDVARIRIGGSGVGASNGLDIQAIGNRSLLRILNDGSLQTAGGIRSDGAISAQNPNNLAAGVNLSFYDNVARIRVGGSGAGAFSGLDIQGPGNTSLLRVHNNGNITIPGSASCGAVVESNLQTEDELAAGQIERFEEGDVLCWGIDRLELCSTANDRLVQAVADPEGRPIVLGAEVIKVIGPVLRGDILVASDVPGYSMVNNNPVPGSVIAQALEGFDGQMGPIKAMIRKW